MFFPVIPGTFPSVFTEKFIKIYDKLENTLGAWARSDEPLFVPMKAKSRVEGKSKIDRAKEKGAVWKFDESVSAIFESYIDGNISGEEFDYLLESVVGDYDYQYEVYL